MPRGVGRPPADALDDAARSVMLADGLWSAANLARTAVGVSASRRTDIPALFGAWFAHRLDAGFAEYIPAGPPRRVRRSLLPADVTHFDFWTKWPRPFFPVLEKVLAAGYPVVWNVTISGLGGTEVEPNVPTADRAVRALLELCRRLPPGAVLWRYDPVFLSSRHGLGEHLSTFTRLVERLAGHVDRVAVNFVSPYARRVLPDLRAYQAEFSDPMTETTLGQRLDLIARLRAVAEPAGIPFTLCCLPDEAAASGCPATGCNAWSWIVRVYPQLAAHRWLKTRPGRSGCECSEEVDIGVYDTCILGCRYSYGSCSQSRARELFATHDPAAPCLVP
ncbi:MAG: DUF1848 family protein [Candidatus Wallbacteria bacterium]|nr:DUF1848 family protein [Candidatus Wallbacteria bacterium]